MGTLFAADECDKFKSPSEDTGERFGIAWSQASYYAVLHRDGDVDVAAFNSLEKHFEFTATAKGDELGKIDIEALATLTQGGLHTRPHYYFGVLAHALHSVACRLCQPPPGRQLTDEEASALGQLDLSGMCRDQCPFDKLVICVREVLRSGGGAREYCLRPVCFN